MQVFLQHLSALSRRGAFAQVWARVLGVQRALLAAPPDDPLTEAALESLKNMILVMDSVRVREPHCLPFLPLLNSAHALTNLTLKICAFRDARHIKII